MFQPTPKRCFTIESLVAKDNPLPASRSEEPIRPAALSYANSSQMNPFLNGFHSSGRGVYSNPDLVFAEAVSHPQNSAVPVHSVPPPHALAAHPLSSSHSPHPLFASQQRDPSTFYPWLIHRYRYLGHRFQGKFLQNILFGNYFDQSSREKKKDHTAQGHGGFSLIIIQMSLLCYILEILKLMLSKKIYNHFIVSKYWLMLWSEV